MKFSTAKALALSISLIVASGCATEPIPVDKAIEVKSSAVYAPQLLEARPNTGKVIVKRDTGFVGSAADLYVMVDGVRAADLQTGEKVSFYLDAGSHILSLSNWAGTMTDLSETSATVADGQALIFRVGYNSAGVLVIQPTAF